MQITLDALYDALYYHVKSLQLVYLFYLNLILVKELLCLHPFGKNAYPISKVIFQHNS